MMLTMTNKLQWYLTSTLLLSAARFAHPALIDLEPTDTKTHYMSVEDLELYLEPLNHVLLGEDTPVYTASGSRRSPHNIRYELVKNLWPSSYNLQRNPVNNVVFTPSEDGNGEIYDGTIEPLPSRFHEVIEGRMDKNGSSNYLGYHESPPRPGQPSFGYAFPRQVPQRSPTAEIVNEGDIVYPEVMVIVDHSTYLAHGKNLQALCEYMAVFWNAVDLRFRAMSQPRIRLNIAGLIVPIDDGGAPYMTKHRMGKDLLRAAETFTEVGKYLHEDKRLNKTSYDLAVVITGLDLCATKGDACDAAIRGVSPAGAVCQHDEDEVDAAVVVIEDHNVFDGVLNAAHEIAHLLGAGHDGEDSDSGPSAKDCDESKGYVMADPQQYSSNAFLWSDCSINQMRDFLKKEGKCLRNKPEVKRPIAKALPGVLLSRDEQCKILHDSKAVACNKDIDDDECGEVYCRKPGGECIISQTPAEGSACSDGGMCLKGVCTHEKEA